MKVILFNFEKFIVIHYKRNDLYQTFLRITQVHFFKLFSTIALRQRHYHRHFLSKLVLHI